MKATGHLLRNKWARRAMSAAVGSVAAVCLAASPARSWSQDNGEKPELDPGFREMLEDMQRDSEGVEWLSRLIEIQEQLRPKSEFEKTHA
jgi:hypothetical protein